MTPKEQNKEITLTNEEMDNILCKLTTGYTRKELMSFPEEDTGLDEFEVKEELEDVDDAKAAITPLIKEQVLEARIDPFEFVESCEPNCDDVRHAHHQGQWDMATRIKAQQEEV